MSTYQEIEIEVEWCPVPIEVGGYYVKAERGARQEGVQMEPDLPAYFEIESVVFKGKAFELSSVLKQSAYDEIERMANLHETTK